MVRRKNIFVIILLLNMLIPTHISQNHTTSLLNYRALFNETTNGQSEIIPSWVNVSQAPFDLSTPEGITNPILTASHVTDVVADFVADPFLFIENNTWYMFFEVYVLSEAHGDIGLATSEDGLHWSYEQIILSEDWHLSYPLVLKINDSYYMVPETHELNEVRFYEASNFPYNWTYNSTIISGRPFTDPSIVRYNNTWWMFVSASGFNDFCYLYYSDNFLTGWIEHPQSPIVSGDASKGRPGGRSFVFDTNRVIRITQKCDVTYGEQVRAFEVDKLTKTAYKEHEIVESPLLRRDFFGWNSDGMHQFDPWWTGDQWVCVADGKSNDIWSIGIFVTNGITQNLTYIIFIAIGIVICSILLIIGTKKIREKPDVVEF